MSDYSEKLKDPQWYELRLQIFKRDGFHCQNCGTSGNTDPLTGVAFKGLEAHHNWYETGREPWDYPLNALITLCRSCHEAETLWRREMENDLLVTLRRKGFLGSDLVKLREEIEKSGRTIKRDWEIPESPGVTREQEREDRRRELRKGELPE